MSELEKLERELKSLSNKSQAIILQRFFKTEPGQYGAGDVFLGIKVPHLRVVAIKYPNLSLLEIRNLLVSNIHEFRMIALFILVRRYEEATDLIEQRKIVDFYLQNTDRINNWDLVDLSVYKILGDFLWRSESANFKDKIAIKTESLLNKLAESKNMWERRMAMISTYAFIKNGQTKETYRLAAILLNDKEDLIQKAVGWMLREAGKRVSEKELEKFLDLNAKTMPRTALRYAIERLAPNIREFYLKK